MAIKRLPSTGDAPRSTGVPAGLTPGGTSDSAGFAWSGRSFDHHGTVFADDDGSTPEALRVAIANVREAAVGSDLFALAETHIEAILALSQSRLLIPLLAEAGDIGQTSEGRIVEKTQELSIVTVTAPDGRRALPVFSSTETMRRWNPEARPIPAPGPQAALAAAQDETVLIIVDPGTEALEYGVRRPAIQAMALGERVLPAWADDEVCTAFEQTVADDPRVHAIDLVPGDPASRLKTPETDVVLTLEAGLGREELGHVLSRAQKQWAANEIIAERVDSMRVLPRASLS